MSRRNPVEKSNVRHEHGIKESNRSIRYFHGNVYESLQSPRSLRSLCGGGGGTVRSDEPRLWFHFHVWLRLWLQENYKPTGVGPECPGGGFSGGDSGSSRGSSGSRTTLVPLRRRAAAPVPRGALGCQCSPRSSFRRLCSTMNGPLGYGRMKHVTSTVYALTPGSSSHK